MGDEADMISLKIVMMHMFFELAVIEYCGCHKLCFLWCFIALIYEIIHRCETTNVDENISV